MGALTLSHFTCLNFKIYLLNFVTGFYASLVYRYELLDTPASTSGVLGLLASTGNQIQGFLHPWQDSAKGVSYTSSLSCKAL